MTNIPCSECQTVLDILKKNPACLASCSYGSDLQTPSYIVMHNNEQSTYSPMGCLVAHTILTALEAQAMSRYFEQPIYRLMIAYEPSIGSSMPSEKLWQALAIGAFLHDIGKLVDEYVERKSSFGRYKRVRHHYVSAIICKKALDYLLNLDYLSLVISYAVLFHHEAIDWKSLEQDFLHYSYLQKVFGTDDSAYYTVNPQRLELFEQNCALLLQQFQRSNLVDDTCQHLLQQALKQAIGILLQNERRTLSLREELQVSVAQESRYFAPAAAVYRFIFFADNRAASARRIYWRKTLNSIKWDYPEEVAESVFQAFRNQRYYIGLSVISEIPSKRL